MILSKFSTLGAMGLVSSLDLGLIILFSQMTSMAVYVLLAMERRDRLSQEALLKYFLYGAIALAIMAYGLSLLYGLTGSLDLRDIGAVLAGGDRLWIAVALVLIVVGYGFEIAVVPFHMWAPDVFAGSSAPVAGFVSVVPKAAALGALARFFVQALPGELVAWPTFVAVLAVATIPARAGGAPGPTGAALGLRGRRGPVHRRAARPTSSSTEQPAESPIPA